MFTGLVSEIGEVTSAPLRDAGGRLQVQTGLQAAPGDSVAVDGACLTVVTCDEHGLGFDVMPESLRVTTLGALAAGDRVNLEPAVRAGEPLGGHIVQGHVDGVATVAATEEDGNALLVTLELPGDLERFIVERGSITVAGTSLTVMGRGDGRCRLSLIPETRERTTLGALSAGDRVNVEADVLARYVEQAVERRLKPA